jgi:GNAT superfamily N-acetyltransferase
VVSRVIALMEDGVHVWRRPGWGAALTATGRELARWPHQHIRYGVLARSLSEALPDLSPPPALEIRAIGPDDLGLVRRIARPSGVRSCELRLARGYQGWLALHDGQAAGHAWATPAPAPTLERAPVRLAPGDVLCAYAYTDPAFRGRGVHTALTLARLRLFRQLGYRRAVAYVQLGNHPSLAVWRKLGAHVVGRADVRRVGPWRLARGPEPLAD